jgi:hypothetical protein
MVNGQNAVAVNDKNKTVYVSNDGTPYPVRVTTQDGSLTLDFDRYNAAVAIAPPPGAIDLAPPGR